MASTLIDEDEQYASEEDSDFAPDTAPAAQDSDAHSDSDGDEDGDRPSKRRRTAAATTEGEDAGYDNSGDEAIIKKGEKKRKKQKSKADQQDEDDEGGEGGLIKTRRQRAAEKEERKIAASTGPVTVDVDAVWAQMLAGDPAASGASKQTTDQPSTDDPSQTKDTEISEAPAPSTNDLIRIKRTYNFAGKVHTEEKLVPRTSAEAKLFFASQGKEVPSADEENSDAAAAAAGLLSKPRIAKKAFRSAFEPLHDPLPQRADLNLGVAARMQAGRDAQAKKLNTVEKSRMDWAGFVDKEGIKDELELAEKSKDSFAARQDFLARSEARREDDARKARLSGKA